MNHPRRHTCWLSKRLHWEGAPGWGTAGQRNPGQLCHVARSTGFMVMGLVSRLSLADYSDSGSFLVVLSQDGFQRGGFWEVGMDWHTQWVWTGIWTGILFGPFLNSSSWWWLVSTLFLTRIFSHKITHANGYYGAWPGGAGLVIVSTNKIIAIASESSGSKCFWDASSLNILLPAMHPIVDLKIRFHFILCPKACPI